MSEIYNYALWSTPRRLRFVSEMNDLEVLEALAESEGESEVIARIDEKLAQQLAAVSPFTTEQAAEVVALWHHPRWSVTIPRAANLVAQLGAESVRKQLGPA